MYDGEFETKLQTVLIVVEALAYLTIAVWLLNRSREGRWAPLGALGAGLVGIVLAVSAAATAELVFLESSWLFDKIFFHAHIQTAFTIGRVAGVLLLLTGLVLSRRTPPAPDRSIYGP